MRIKGGSKYKINEIELSIFCLNCQLTNTLTSSYSQFDLHESR